jgi:alpha-mannosidase
MVYFRENAAFQDALGNAIPIKQVLQSVRGFNSKWEFVDTLPAQSYKAYHFDNDQLVERPEKDTIHFKQADLEVVNKFLEPLSANINFLVLDDDSDTWGHGMKKYVAVTGEFELESSAIMPGKITTKLCQKYSWGKSSLEVIFSVFNGLPGMYAEIKVNWAEHRKILKLEIDPDQPQAEDMIMQCAGGTAVRKVNGRELPFHHWVWLPTGEKGMAVIQNGAFAGDCLDGRLRLTLVRSSLYGFHDPCKLDPADPQFDTDQGMHFFKMLILPNLDYDEKLLNSQAEILNEPFSVIRES